ncbi:hypothetical protein D3C71_1297350 [compost metagenome]
MRRVSWSCGILLSPPVAACRRRLWASINAPMECWPSPTTSAGRRMAAATTSKPITTMRRSRPSWKLSSSTRLSKWRAASMACCTSSMVRKSTATPWPCSPSSGLTTTRWCSSRKARLSSALPAICCAGRFNPAALSTLWVRLLSWHRVMLTALVRSLRDSRQRTRRPPWLRVNIPASASSTCTSMPRRCASSTMIRA